MTCLNRLHVGAKAKVSCLLSDGLLKERMMALGFTQGASIEVVRKGPEDNLTVYSIRGAMIALRREESDLILVN